MFADEQRDGGGSKTVNVATGVLKNAETQSEK
jgi:hypothetical protein